MHVKKRSEGGGLSPLKDIKRKLTKQCKHGTEPNENVKCHVCCGGTSSSSDSVGISWNFFVFVLRHHQI